MHKNRNRGTAPSTLAYFQVNQTTYGYNWDDFAKSPEYGEVLKRMHSIFYGLCAYCEAVVVEVKRRRRTEAKELKEVHSWLRGFNEIRGYAEDWRETQVEILESSQQGKAVIVSWLRGEVGDHFKLRLPLEGSAEYWRLGMIQRLEGDAGPIDHFRPRNPQRGSQQDCFGQDFTFEWTNLMYACPKCQDDKANAWPGTMRGKADEKANGSLRNKAEIEGYDYICPSSDEGYINPEAGSSDAQLQPFDFDDNGNIVSRAGVEVRHRSRADRTIFDLKLNDAPLVYRRDSHILQLFLLVSGQSLRRREQILDSYANPLDHKGAKYKPAIEFPTLVEAATKKRWFHGRQGMPPRLRKIYDQYRADVGEIEVPSAPKETPGRASGARSRGPRARRGP